MTDVHDVPRVHVRQTVVAAVCFDVERRDHAPFLILVSPFRPCHWRSPATFLRREVQPSTEGAAVAAPDL